MNESKKRQAAMPAEDELIDILLDFIMVSASLAKKITQAIRVKEGKCYGQDERTADRDCRTSQRRRDY